MRVDLANDLKVVLIGAHRLHQDQIVTFGNQNAKALESRENSLQTRLVVFGLIRNGHSLDWDVETGFRPGLRSRDRKGLRDGRDRVDVLGGARGPISECRRRSANHKDGDRFLERSIDGSEELLDGVSRKAHKSLGGKLIED